MKKTILSVLMVALIASFAFANGTTEAAYPSQGIELVIPASAGGGSDRMGRLLAEIIQAKGLNNNQVITCVNKNGGSGAVGQAYVNAKSNPDYTLFTVNDAHTLGANVGGTVPTTSKRGNFTPIAMLGVDEVLFVTLADSPYQTMDDVVAAAKANPGKFTAGCADQLDKICVYDINNSYGIELTTTLFGGAGEIATALLGGHVQFGMFNPSECASFIEAGQLKALGLMSEERTIAPFTDVPTFTEMGHPELVYSMTRGILANGNMSEEAQKYWSDVFKAVCESAEWQEYCTKYGVTNQYMDCEEYAKFYVENEKVLLEKLAIIGE